MICGSAKLQLEDKDCPSSKPSGSINTASKESWALAERWLSDCNVSHQRCTSLHNNHWLPTRLLDLEGHKLKNTARLVDRCDAPRSARYVTLSHRWGSHIPVYLNKATELQLRAGIQVGALSQAFQDAIEISLRLQVRYIWIDSLCIMQDQDDLRDWMKEAATMNQVYMHSYLNISSLAASDSNSSFFAERNPDSTQETHVETRLKECQLGETWLKYHVSDVKWMERNIEDTPLNRRAWVLQERLISPRVLHFGREQLVWECIETERAESCPEGLPRLYTKWGFKSTLYDYNPWKEIGPHSGPALQKEPYHSWNRVVQVYSKCSMTKSEDKLIAIAGIAKQMANIVQDEYVCGMWRRCLPSMLLWLVADRQQANGSLPHRPTEYRAPSFSWASVDGVIAPGHPDNHDLLFEVLDVKLAFATEDITGLVTGGSLLLKGQVQRLSIRPNTSGNSVFEHIASVNGVDVVPADVSFTPIWLDEHETYFDPNAADQETLFCVPAREDGEVQYMEVLPLQVVDATEGTYRRFGLSCVRTKREREVFRRPPKEPVNIPAVAVEDGMHIIRLI